MRKSILILGLAILWSSTGDCLEKSSNLADRHEQLEKEPGYYEDISQTRSHGTNKSVVTKMTERIPQPLKIGGWNVQRFGQAKVSKENVRDIIVEVIRHYDIMVVMEVVDSKLEAPYLLLEALNTGLLNDDDYYNLTISERLGDTTYKEQYAFYYKPARVTVDYTYQYNDSIDNVFQFEPFVVVFKGAVEGLDSFGIAPIHTKPSKAVEEINRLANVYDAFVKDTGNPNLMIMGDYNAGCSYVGSDDWPNIRLHYDKKFKWMISDHADTTTKGTTCPYDRIVIAGDDLLNAVYKDTAQPFYFDDFYNITNDELLEDVSDHYPVEIQMKSKLPEEIQETLGSQVQIAVVVNSEVTPDAMINMVAEIQAAKCTNNTTNTTTADQQLSDCLSEKEILLLEWSEKNIEDLELNLINFSAKYPEVLNSEALQVLIYKIHNHVLRDASLYGEEQEYCDLSVELLCRQSKSKCSFIIKSSTSIN